MDEKIDRIISLAGNENFYQYFTLIVIYFFGLIAILFHVSFLL